MPAIVDVDSFLAQKRLAFVGVSRNPKQFANKVYQALKERGYQLYPVNPHADQLEGDRCYPTPRELPEPVEGALVMVAKESAAAAVQECLAAGIPRIWLGLGTSTPEAVRLCREAGIPVVDGACPMMFAEPVGTIHRFHRFVLRLTGSLPKKSA